MTSIEIIPSYTFSAETAAAFRAAALACLVQHVKRNAQAVIATQSGSADETVANLVAAGWTLENRVDQVAGKRIRYLRAS